MDREPDGLVDAVTDRRTDALTAAVDAVRAMPGEVSRQGLQVLARDLLDPDVRQDPDAQEPGEDIGPSGVGPSGAPEDPAPEDPAPGDPAPDDTAPDDTAPDDTAADRAGDSGSLLGRVVDVFVGARRLANWALWLQLAAAAQLISRWQSSPPIVDGAFDAPAPDDLRSTGLAERLWRLVADLEIWGPLKTRDLAEAFVASEIAAAAGLSHYNADQVVDGARALFLTSRLPRTRVLMRAGLVDWNKLCTIVSATRLLDDEVCALVEAAVITDADLAVAEPLDVLADPSRPGALLPAISRVNNPTLRAQLHGAIAAIDAEAAARRSRRARSERAVWGTPLPDGMGRLQLETGQEQIAAILTGLDEVAAAAKATGDPRRMDQIRCDHAVHLLTHGAFGTRARRTDDDTETYTVQDADDLADGSALAARGTRENPATSGGTGRTSQGPDRQRAGKKLRKDRRRGLQIRLTVPLSTWLGLAEDPAVLDGYGPIPAAIARQIAAEAARDHPTTTTWRCVVVGDRHRTVLGVGDLLPTPRHDPTVRQASFARTAEPFCVFPGCRVQAWRCDLDHRIPYDADHPAAGGATCTCNIEPLCRRHHRLRTAGLITPHFDAVGGDAVGGDAVGGDAVGGNAVVEPGALADADVPPGTVIWTTFTGRSYEHRPPAATPDPAPRQAVAAAAAIAARRRAEETGTPMDEIYDRNTAVGQWDLSRRLQQERAERAAARRRRPPQDWDDDRLPQDPPF